MNIKAIEQSLVHSEHSDVTVTFHIVQCTWSRSITSGIILYLQPYCSEIAVKRTVLCLEIQSGRLTARTAGSALPLEHSIQQTSGRMGDR